MPSPPPKSSPSLWIKLKIIYLNALLIQSMVSERFRKRNMMYLDQTLCFEQVSNFAYPQILGGTVGDSQFNCVGYDSTNSFLIAGGYSASTDVVDSATSAIMVKLDSANGRVIWHTQIKSALSDIIKPASISSCSLQEGSTPLYLIAVSTMPQYAYLIIDYATGDLIDAYYEIDTSTSSISSTLSPVGVFMDSSNRIVVLSYNGNYIYISSYSYSPGTSSPVKSFSKSYGNSSNKAVAIQAAFLSSKDYLFIAGQHNGLPIIILTSFLTGIPLTNAIFNVSGSSTSKSFTRVAYFLNATSGLANLFSFSNFLGSSGFDVAFIYITEVTVAGAGTLQGNASWYISQTSQVDCIAIRYVTSQLQSEQQQCIQQYLVLMAHMEALSSRSSQLESPNLEESLFPSAWPPLCPSL